MDLQAIRYAAMVSSMLFEDVVRAQRLVPRGRRHQRIGSRTHRGFPGRVTQRDRSVDQQCSADSPGCPGFLA